MIGRILSLAAAVFFLAAAAGAGFEQERVTHAPGLGHDIPALRDLRPGQRRHAFASGKLLGLGEQDVRNLDRGLRHHPRIGCAVLTVNSNRKYG